MSQIRHELAITLLVLALSTGCKKDEQPMQSSGGTPWMGYVAVSVDSAFIMAPNVVTPNGDGINDEFYVIGRHVSSLQCSALNANGDVVFSSQSLYPVWNELDTTDLGRYDIYVSAVSISGIALAARSDLYVMDYDTNMCLPFAGMPATGDQFDPRIFGVSYPTNEIFCE